MQLDQHKSNLTNALDQHQSNLTPNAILRPVQFSTQCNLAPKAT